MLGWLFGYSLTPITVLFSRKAIAIYTSETKLNVLASLKEHPKFAERNVQFLKREKQTEANQASHARLLEIMEESEKNPRVGTLSKGKEGALDEFEQFIKERELKTVDALSLLNECMIVKDANEVKCMERSASITTYFFHKLVDNILHIIDNEQTASHA